MNAYKSVIGIDVSKSTLDIAELGTCRSELYQIGNDDVAILSWLGQFDLSDTLFVLEATGAYSKRLTYHLGARGAQVSVVNPLRSAAYTNALGITTKNDRQAARTLALMGSRFELPLYQQPSDTMHERKQLLLSLHALKKQQQMLKNQLHALEHQIIFSPLAVETLRQTLQTVETSIRQLEEQLNQLEDDEYEHQFELITSVVGIGPVCAQALLTATGGLQNFERAEQLLKFVGIAPASHQSGSSIKTPGRITRKGNNALRAALYMAARSAKRFNLSCQALYQRLRARGKAHKQAMVAIMAKLLRQIFGVVKSGHPFDNRFFLQFLN